MTLPNLFFWLFIDMKLATLIEGITKDLHTTIKKMRSLPYVHSINVDFEDEFTFSLFFGGNQQQWNQMNSNLNLFGYFISDVVEISVGERVLIDNNDFDKVYSRFPPNKIYDLFKEYPVLFIRCDIEAKDTRTIKNPGTMYHATTASKADKILRQGLVPKAYNKISLHPERIYLGDLAVAEKMSSYLRRTFSEPSAILKVNTKGFDIYHDPQLYGAGFVTSPISPDRIKRIGKNISK